MAEPGTLTAFRFEALKLSLEARGSAEFLFEGTSMEPLMRAGDRIVVEPPRESLKPWDIVVFRDRGIMICHVLGWIEPERDGRPRRLATFSYNGLHRDPPIEDSALLGKVVSHRLSWAQRALILLRLALS